MTPHKNHPEPIPAITIAPPSEFTDGEWDVPADYCIFSTGRRAWLRRQLPSSYLLSSGKGSSELLEIMEVMADPAREVTDLVGAMKFLYEVCVGMWYDPLVRPRDMKPSQKTFQSRQVIDFEVLEQSEVIETMTRAIVGVKQMLYFRELADRSRDSENGDGVRQDAKRDSGVAKGRPRKSRTRSGTKSKTARAKK